MHKERKKQYEPRCSHVNLPLCVCVCVYVCVCAYVCMFKGLVYKSFIYLCMHVMKSFKYFLRLLYTEKPHAEFDSGLQR